MLLVSLLMKRGKIMQEINRHINAMCIIGGVFALLPLISWSMHSIIAILMLVVIPLGCCILFWITEQPAFGIIYTVLFFLNRISVFIGGGNFLAAIIIILLLLYFIYVDCICTSLRNELSKREVEELINRYEESKDGSQPDQEENTQFFNWPEN